MSMLLGAAVALSASFPVKTMLDMKASFVECCSCEGTCSFEASGRVPGCHGMGVYQVAKGSYGGKDISGSKFAYVTAPGDVLLIYIDTKKPDERKTVEALAKVLFAEGFGKLESVKDASISLTGMKGKSRFTINSGKTADVTIQPVFGGDGKTPVEMKNVFGDPYDELFQGRVVKASFQDSGHAFELKGTSAFYLDDLKVKKKI